MITTNLIKEYGSWLQKFRWNWMGTYTFAYPPSKQAATRGFKRYVEKLMASLGTAVYAVWMVEKGTFEREHVHALIGFEGTFSNRCSSASSDDCTGCGTHLWRGLAEVRTYDEAKGGVFYLVKTINRPDAELEILGTPKLKTQEEDSSSIDSGEVQP